MIQSASMIAARDQAAFDREFNNRAKVADADSIIARWYSDGQTARTSMSCRLDIAYGSHERQRLDIFPAPLPQSPILAFIHGGYWSSRDRAMAHFLAPFYVACGVTFASVGYRLCPEVQFEDVVDDARRAIAWLHANADSCGGDPKRLFVAGHSAGGHLAALLCGPQGPGMQVLKGGCSISGLHDLETIRLSYVNHMLNLDGETAKRFSPLAHALTIKPGTIHLPPLIAAVGDQEGQEYLRQRDSLVSALRQARQPVALIDIADGNHFSACEAFSDPSHPLQEAMIRMIFSPTFPAAAPQER